MSVNGVKVVHCDSLVKEALATYWGDKPEHYVRKSRNIQSYMVSKAVDRLIDEKPKLAIMAE